LFFSVHWFPNILVATLYTHILSKLFMSKKSPEF